MSRYRRNYLLHFTLLLLAGILASVEAQIIPFCYNTGNYTDNSSYESNLRTLFSYLSANVDENRFYNASVGQSPNRVYGMLLCRVDVNVELCGSCIRNATDALIQECPNRMQAVLWDEFCSLRYSNHSSIIGTMETTPYTFLYNTQNSTRPDDFMSDLGILLGNISSEASRNGGSLRRKVAYGSIRTYGFQTIYAIEECIPDLSTEDCSYCLNTAIQVVPRESYGAIGARILLPSCNLRYEVVPFYNDTRLQELLPMIRPPNLTRTGDYSLQFSILLVLARGYSHSHAYVLF